MIIDVFFLKNSCKLILEKLEFKKDHYSINDIVLNDLVNFINKDIKRYNLTHQLKADEFDIASLITFWFRKLKPLEPRVNKKKYTFINEQIGIFLGMNILDSVYNKKRKKILGENLEQFKQSKLNDYLSKHLDEFCFILRYRAVSPHIICLVLKTLYFFLNYTEYITIENPQSLKSTPLVEFLKKEDWFLKH